MLSLLNSVILGAVEGFTEFLPVSSSGHLILARAAMGINAESGLAFDAVLQLGSILAAFLYFRKDVAQLIRTAWLIVTGKRKQVSQADQTLFFGIIIGSIPAVILGLLLKHLMETIFRSPGVVAGTLIAGSLLFIYAERVATKLISAPNLKQSWWIGCFQTLALVPGVSRSGATISGGLILGLTRESATRFSFLMSLPIIAGSGLLGLRDILKSPSLDFSLTALVLGFLIAFITGYLSIGWLLRYLKTHSLFAFVWYRMALAAVVLIILAIK